MGWYQKHRPTTFKGIVGQGNTVQTLQGMWRRNEIPHATLIVGPSGTGKTTLARILANKLECSEQDFCEINAADSRGVDTFRDIRSRIGLSPMGGKCRVWLLDECHRLTGDSQSLLLKVLEDTPAHVYFFLCTTDDAKLLKTIKTRCTLLRLDPIPPADLEALVFSVAEKEGIALSEEVARRIVEVADGSARQALVDLEKIAGITEEEDRLNAIQPSAIREKYESLAKIINNPRSKWAEAAAVIKSVEESEIESIRRGVIGYAAAILLNGGNPGRCYKIICAFESDFFSSGRAGLVRAAWEVFSSER